MAKSVNKSDKNIEFKGLIMIPKNMDYYEKNSKNKKSNYKNRNLKNIFLKF
jgi:hypothetical protein